MIAGGKREHEILGAVARSAVDDEDLGDFAGLGDQSGQARTESARARSRPGPGP